MTVGTGLAWQPLPSTTQTAAVGVLKVGFTYDMVGLLQSFKEEVRVVNPDELSPALAKEMPFLVIPSAGLYGMEQSAIFKAALEAYVSEGGSILVMGQQYGYAYASLPGKVDGYGWLEDQMCFANSSYIATWHPILAAQTRSTPTIGVDGYFTAYPDSATVLLRRTANGQPDLIMYRYGNGYVIVNSFYSDSAFARGETSVDDKNLIRDIVSWAKAPVNLPEVKLGESLILNIPVKNNTNTTINATQARIRIYDPDKKNILYQTSIPINLAPGEEAVVPVTYTAALNSPTGIYQVQYDLTGESLWYYDDDDPSKSQMVTWLLKDLSGSPSGRFAVINPPKTGYQLSGITYAIQSDSFAYVNNTPATFTIKIWNNSDVQRTITAKYDDQSQNVIIAPKGLEAITYSKNITWGKTGLTATFFDETNRYLGSTFRNSTIISPATKTATSFNKAIYAKGESVAINTTIQNTTLSEIRTSWQADVKTTIYDSTYYAKVFEDTQTVTMQPSQTANVTSNYILPTTAKLGTYTIYTYIMTGSSSVGWAYFRFDVAESKISTIPNMPSSFVAGVNTIPFTLSNIGRIDVHAGVLSLTLTAPDRSIAYTGSQTFALATGATTTINMPVTIPSPQLGNYSLTYSVADETKTENSPPVTIPFISNMVTLVSTLDKPSYKVREIANLVINATNTGKFNLENTSLTVSIPDINYNETRTVSLMSNASERISFTIPIPDTLPPGSHVVNIALTLPSGNSVVQNKYITIPYPSFKIDYTGPTSLNIGDMVTFSVENTGGVDADTEVIIQLVNQEPPVYRNNLIDTIIAGGSKTYTFTIPLQSVDGGYDFYVRTEDRQFGGWNALNKEITITGVKAGLSVRTDKDMYLATENVIPMATIANGAYPIDNANLHLQIVNKCYQIPYSYYISTWDGANWVERGVLHYAATLGTQVFDLSAFLPDAAGEHKARIRQQSSYYNDDAAIDYVAMRTGGIDYQPSTALNLTANTDILSEVSVNDGMIAGVIDNEIEVRWNGLPQSPDAILVMKAREGRFSNNDEQCVSQIVWDTDIPISQAANTVNNLSRLVDPLSPGQYYLQGTLRSRTNQIISEHEYPFAVIGGDFGLSLTTDKAIYRPGETMTINGKVWNQTVVDAVGLLINVTGYPNISYSETVTIPANSSHTFTFTATSGAARERQYSFWGDVSQNNTQLAYANAYYNSALPNISYDGDAPEAVDRNPFQINVYLNNQGKIPGTITLNATGGALSDTRTVTLQPGEMRTIAYTQAITADTVYTVELTGDVDDVLEYTVLYGERANIVLAPQAMSPEGKLAVPVTVSNTGEVDELLTVHYELMQQSALVSRETRTYYVLIGESAPDTLNFTLAEGDYQLSAVSQLPIANTQALFSVRQADNIQFIAALGTQANGLYPVTATVTNLGLNPISGSIRVSVVSSQGAVAWTGEQAVPQLFYQNAHTASFVINPNIIPPAEYTVRVELLDNGNQQLAIRTFPLLIQGAIIQLIQVPPYQTFSAGQEATLTFRVKNVGNQDGSGTLHLKAYDLIDATRSELLLPGEEKDIAFSFLMPTDLEEKDYYADYELKGQGAGVKGQVKYHLAGINIQVNATLDQQAYNVGDTAHLTISVTSQSTTTLNLAAQAVYGEYEARQPFVLNGSQTLTFDVPLAEITGQKLYYGIHLESGRSLHLNSLYVYKAGDGLIITTDKQVYNPGEAVGATIRSQVPGATGQMTLSISGGASETFAFTGVASRNFTLPARSLAGSYFIDAVLSQPTGTLSAQHAIDVAGLDVLVKDAKLDKGKYNPTDTLIMTAKVESNMAFSGIMKGSIIDPDKVVVPVGQRTINITSQGDFPITGNYALSTTKAGIHNLMYGVYDGDILLASGTLAFDVGDAALLSISPDKKDYPTNTEPVKAIVSMYGIGIANLEIQVDGTLVKTEPVALGGITTMSYDLPAMAPGKHVLKGILTSGELTSTKESSFVYGSGLADLLPIVASDGQINQGNTMQLMVSVTNLGAYASGATTVSLFDGDTLIDTRPVRALNGGETDSIAVPWNVVGQTGDHIIKAVVDPLNTLVEFNKLNNTSTISVRIPTGPPADTTPPVTTTAIGDPKYASSNGRFIVHGSTQFTFVATDDSSGVARIEYSLDSGSFSTYVAPLTLALYSDGTHTIAYRSTDNAGNIETDNILSVILDKTPPLTTATPVGGIYNWAQSVVLTSNEAATIYYTTDGTMPTSNSPAYGSPITITATTTLKRFAVDQVGNSEIVSSATYTIDTTPPILTLSTLPDNAYTNNATLNIAGAATDNVAVQGVTINNAAIPVNANGAFSQVLTLKTGPNAITTVASDTAGNTAADTRTITLDQKAPLLVIANPSDNSVTNAPELTVLGTVDEASTVMVKVNNNSPLPALVTSATFSLPVTLAYGLNTIEVTATDLAVNNTTDKRTITHDNVNPSLAVTYPAQDITTNQTSITLRGTVSDLTALTLTVQHEGVVSTPTVTAGMFQQELTFTAEKQYPIIVTATDAAGNTTTVQRNIIYTTIQQGNTTLTYTGATLIAQGRAVTLSGVLKADGTPPNPFGQTISFTLGTGSSSQSCIGATDADGKASCTIRSATAPLGPTTVTAIFAGDSLYQPSSDSKSVTVFAYPAMGSFVIGDKNAVLNKTVTFWGSQWWKNNTLSNGTAPASFKGYADNTSATPPGCGGTWSTGPGNSSSPPNSVPSYMAVLVSSSVSKSGSSISGNTVKMVIVKTNGGYGPDPGHTGTGTVVGVVSCK